MPSFFCARRASQLIKKTEKSWHAFIFIINAIQDIFFKPYRASNEVLIKTLFFEIHRKITEHTRSKIVAINNKIQAINKYSTPYACGWLIYYFLYCSYLALEWLNRCHTVPSSWSKNRTWKSGTHSVGGRGVKLSIGKSYYIRERLFLSRIPQLVSQ